tara:strand:- start:476 stop:724 length:249 start_codon:yes stop_codon:yes gene_type:complete
MKTVLLVNIAPVYISNDTCQPVNLTDNQKLLSSLFTDEFTFVQLYTPLVKFSGKTYKDLEAQINKFSTDNKIYDFESIIIKK